jgi:site-specific DNA-cytosine methylase
MVGLLRPERKQQLLSNVQGKHFSIGTMCSGTDVCCDVVSAILQHAGGSHTHMFSCEIGPAKQRWIMAMCSLRPKCMFENVMDFYESRARCLIAGQHRAVPGANIIFMGFSCKDVSHMNIYSANARDCIKQKSLRTGSTLSGGMQYVRRHRPKLVFLENVAALDDINRNSGISNADELFHMFRLLGYHLFSTILDARSHGACQRRTRWWGVAVRVRDDSLTDKDMAMCSELAVDFLDVLSQVEMLPVNLDTILMEERGEQLKAWMESGRPGYVDDDGENDEADKAEQQQQQQVKWPELHHEVFRMAGLRYPPIFAMHYTQEELARMDVLPDRAKQVVLYLDLTLGRVVLPGMQEQVADVLQSINRVPTATGATPCILPHGLLWLRGRMRLMQANECLAAQGFPLYARPELANFSDVEVVDLAGNAFCSNTCMAFVLAALSCFDLSDN